MGEVKSRRKVIHRLLGGNVCMGISLLLAGLVRSFRR